MQVPDPAQVAALIATLDDVTLEDRVAGLGIDDVLSQIFAEMARRFLPEKAARRTAVIQYDIRLRDGAVHSWQMTISQGRCFVDAGARAQPSVTAAVALPRFLRLLTGTLDPVAAFLSGELRLRGDVLLAQQMQGWFDRHY